MLRYCMLQFMFWFVKHAAQLQTQYFKIKNNDVLMMLIMMIGEDYNNENIDVYE